MCRWVAYTGEPLFIDQVVTLPQHSLVVQSRDTKMNFDTDGSLMSVNGDGFGIGWYANRSEPALYRDERPAWSNRNLRSICHQTIAPLFFAHVRASTTGGVQQTNCHPFVYKNWMFQHNGHVDEFEKLRQELQGEVAPELFRHIQGSTDSETMFFLALTYGLIDNPKQGLRRMIERVQAAAGKHKTEGSINLSVALSDGKTLYTLRYAENDEPNTQFYAEGLAWQGEEPDQGGRKTGIVVVSEPLTRPDDTHWQEVPENAFLTIQDQGVKIEKF